MPVFPVQVMMNTMIGAASKPNVTLSRHRGDLRQALHAPNTEPVSWQLTVEPNGQAPFTPTSTSPSSVQAQGNRNKLGNYHCNNRVYSIGAGRWLSPDQADQAPNMFDYAGCMPLTTTDPTGLIAIFINGNMAGATDGGIGKMYRDYKKETGRSAVAFEWNSKDAIIGLICSIKCQNPKEPICLVGFSYGGATALEVAQYFEKNKCLCFRSPVTCNTCNHPLLSIEEVPVKIDYLGLIDEVDSFRDTDPFIPTSVRRVSNYRSGPVVFVRAGVMVFNILRGRGLNRLFEKYGRRGVKVVRAKYIPNVKHTEVDDNKKVQDMVLQDLEAFDSAQ